MKLKPEVKARWLAALRSGEYLRGTGTLYNGCDSYCCLGVLLKEYGYTLIPATDRLGAQCVVEGVTTKPVDGIPYVLLEKFFKDTKNNTNSKTTTVPIQSNKTTSPTLVHLNDLSGASFAEISDVIEECL
jgi:hypothetical protein